MSSYIYPISRNFLNISGGTVTGNTYFQTNLSADTIFSGSTELSLLFSDKYWRIGSAGNYSIKVLNNSLTDATGNYAFAQGYDTVASGEYSHVNGVGSQAIGSAAHAEGGYNTAYDYCHAQGIGTTAIGVASHTQGIGTYTYGDYSHAQGSYNTTFGTNSFVGGNNSSVNAPNSFVFGVLHSLYGLRSAILGGSGITGSSDDTVYVPYFNIQSADTASMSDYFLAIDSNGEVKKSSFNLFSGSTAATIALSGITGGVLGDTIRHNGTEWTANNFLYNNGTYIGINNTSPSAQLDVSGKTRTTNFQMLSGASPGYILTSANASGDAYWALYTGGGSGATTFISNGLNTYTGGTAINPTVNISAATLDTLFVSGSSSVNSLSATTLYSGNTDMSLLFSTPSQLTRIQNGINIYTGGTGINPTINISAATLNEIIVSGISIFNSLSATTVTTPIIVGGSGSTSGIIYSASSNSAITTTAIAHSLQGGPSGTTVFVSINHTGKTVFNASGANIPASITQNFAILDANTSRLQIGQGGGTAGYTNIWMGPSTPSTTNFVFQSNGNSQTTINGFGLIRFQNGGPSDSMRINLNSVIITPAAASAGGTQFTFTAAAHTNMAASTDTPAVLFNMSANRQFATGAKSTQSEVDISAPTYSSVGATTISEAVTLHITGAPIAGSNVTITNSYAAHFNGAVKFGNGISGSTLTANPGNGWNAIYNSNVAPTSINYTLSSNGVSSSLNSISAVTITNSGVTVLSVESSSIIASQTLNLRPGTSVAGTSPFKFSSTIPVLQTTPETWAFEVSRDGQLFFTPSGGTNHQRNFIGLDSYTAKTDNYTATTLDQTIDCTANTFTVTLPTAAASVTGVPAGRIYRIINTGTGVITINTTDGQTINGAASQSLSTQYSGMSLQSTGTNWIIISKYS